MANKTNLNGQKPKAALDIFADIGLRRRKNRINDTPTFKKTLVHCGMYFITPMLL